MHGSMHELPTTSHAGGSAAARGTREYLCAPVVARSVGPPLLHAGRKDVQLHTAARRLVDQRPQVRRLRRGEAEAGWRVIVRSAACLQAARAAARQGSLSGRSGLDVKWLPQGRLVQASRMGAATMGAATMGAATMGAAEPLHLQLGYCRWHRLSLPEAPTSSDLGAGGRARLAASSARCTSSKNLQSQGWAAGERCRQDAVEASALHPLHSSRSM